MAERQTFASYLKAAFTNRWNLLFLFAVAGASAILHQQADVVLLLAGAVEIGFLGMIATNPRFHRAVDAQLDAAEAAQGAQVLRARFDELYRGLDQRYRQKFDELRSRCVVLADLAGRGGDAEDIGVGQVAQEQLSGVNKLLWVYLKLLHTRGTLERFFQSIDPSELDQLEKDAQRRLEELPKDLADPMVDKKKKSLEDTLATVAARRDNIKKAQENHDFVSLEMERIAAKLTGIAELAVNRQDPGLLTHDVDDVARSVQATEEAIGELQSFTGLTVDDVRAPEILSAPERARA
jgi:hypothetical protein